MYYHKQTFVWTPQIVQEWVSDFFIDQERHQLHIRRQFETRFVMGRMRGRTVAEPPPSIDVFVPVHRENAVPRRPTAPASNVPTQRPVRDQTPVEDVDVERPLGQENDEIINEFPVLFDCFSSKGFDLAQFKIFARNFLSNKPERTDKKEWDKFEKDKAKVVSVLAQNLYTMCTLSTGQMKTSHPFGR